MLPLKILTLLFSVLGDSSLSQDLGKSHNSSAAGLTGGHHRLDDDQSDCADDITRLCHEIPKGNNFALLVCLQEKAKVLFIIIRFMCYLMM